MSNEEITNTMHETSIKIMELMKPIDETRAVMITQLVKEIIKEAYEEHDGLDASRVLSILFPIFSRVGFASSTRLVLQSAGKMFGFEDYQDGENIQDDFAELQFIIEFASMYVFVKRLMPTLSMQDQENVAQVFSDFYEEAKTRLQKIIKDVDENWVGKTDN